MTKYDSNKPPLDDQLKQVKQQYEQEQYQQLVNTLKPKPNLIKNFLGAFLVGGAISAFAQVLINLFSAYGLSLDEAGSATIILMIFIGALLTGLGVYDNLAQFAGAGSIIPITGFANSIVSPAMEFKREGYVYGVGARMFNIAGPVLVYGFLVSFIIGLVIFLFQ